MKRLIVCCDGTWNDADAKTAQTNVFRLATAVHALQDTGGVQQSVLYLRGVGTTGLKLGDAVEGAIGFGIDENILSGYMFLAQNYLPDDEIFLFGFSRGAFTARSLAGFIHCAGLLKRQSLGRINDAWQHYRDNPGHGPADLAAAAKLDTYTDVAITMLGVWDTVGALGIPGFAFAADNRRHYGFHSTGSCSTVRHAYHALAIDEHRDTFVPTLWTGDVAPGCTVEQVWFAGVHSDVGGGYRLRGLADIPLTWMAQKAQAHGLALDWTCLPSPDALDPLAAAHDSETGFFAINRLRPTLREVCGMEFSVTPFERLYAPLKDDGTRALGINEKVHASVVRRYGQLAAACRDDAAGRVEQGAYRPKNVGALFDPAGGLRQGVVVAT